MEPSKMIAETIKSVNNLEWCRARLRYSAGFVEVRDNPEVMTMVAARQLAGALGEPTNWDRFEAMTPEATVSYITNAYQKLHPDDDQDDDQEDDKSGVLETASEVLPGNGADA